VKAVDGITSSGSIFLTRDIVPVEDATRHVARELHDSLFLQSGVYHVPIAIWRVRRSKKPDYRFRGTLRF